MSYKTKVLNALIVSCIMSFGCSYKILLFPSHQMKSHIVYFNEFGAALTENNHSVHMLLPSIIDTLLILNKNIIAKSYSTRYQRSVTSSEEYGKTYVHAIKAEDSGGRWKAITAITSMLKKEMENDCVNILSDSKFVDSLIREQYDFVVSDIIEYDCVQAFVYKLGVPSAVISVQGAQWFYRLPMLPSITANVLMDSTDSMNFIQRLENVIMTILTATLPDNSQGYIQRFVPEKEAKKPHDILRNVSLWFYLCDPLLNYPSARMPNTIDIGDIMQRDAKKLPKDYEALLNGAQAGAILMSFGSHFHYMPTEWTNKFCEAFHQINSNVRVIWKSEITPTCNLSSNVIIRSWIPQNDLLGHPNLQMVITHGGWNSYAESANHAKPMIVFPFLLDQKYNTRAMEAKGMGIRMDIKTFTSDELVQNIDLILNNDSFSQNAKQLSRLLAKRETSAKQRINFWIEHVIRFGGQHLRNSGYELSLFQFLMLDIIAVIILSLVFICITFIGVFVLCIKALKFCCSRKSKMKHE